MLSVSLRSAVDFLHVMYIKDEQLLVFNFIFYLLWTGEGFLCKFCSFFRVLCAEIDCEKRGTGALRVPFALVAHILRRDRKTA